MLDDIIRASGIHPSRIFNVYLFGSRVYGTYNRKSDFDIIMVANNSVESTELRRGIYNIHVYTPDKFKADLDQHRINNLECIFAPDFAKLKESINYKEKFKLDLNKLRHSISHTSSNSWVKAKKKLSNEYLIGIKSLFHSLRIPMFGNQISKYGSIVDFECANDIWDRLIFRNVPDYMLSNHRWTWEELDNEFRNIRNSLLSEFRIETSKNNIKK